MSWVLEKVSEFKALVFIQTDEGEIRISRHKVLILVCFITAFVLTFTHFSTIPPDVITDIQEGVSDSIPSSRLLGISVLIYLYITMVAFISAFKGGTLPNFLTRPSFPEMRNRFKVLIIVLSFIFSSLIIYLIILSFFFSSILLLYTGPVLFIIWTVLEPYFLLSGIIAIIRIISPSGGFTSRTKKILIGFFIFGYIAPAFSFLFLLRFYTGNLFSEIPIFGQTISFYLPALTSFSASFSSILSLSLLYLIVWWLKDRFRGPSALREKKKGIFPWFLGLTLLFIIITIVPLITSTSGSLQELSSILDIFGLMAAMFMGIWNALGVEQETTPIKGIQRLNPVKLINRIHPYSKTLFLFVLSFFAFYTTLQNSTIAVLTGIPDPLKLQKLELLAAFVGFAYFILLWRYKGQPRTTVSEIIRSTRQQIESSFQKVKSAFVNEEVSVQREFVEEK